MTHLQTVRNAIVAVAAPLVPVTLRHIYPQVPESVQDAPALIVFPPSRFTIARDTQKRFREEDWGLHLLVDRYAGKLDANLDAILPLLDALIDTFDAHLLLNGALNVRLAQIVDGENVIESYGGQQFVAYKCTFHVSSWESNSFGT